jgi:hypothetical protein
MGAGTWIMTMQSKNTDTESDWLELALRADGVEHRSTYVDDGGFAARVMSKLPQPVTLPAWRRPVIALLWLAAGIAAVLAVPGLFDDVFRGAAGILLGHRIGVADIAALLVLPGAALWGMLVYAARVE